MNYNTSINNFYFELAQNFKKEHGNLSVPLGFKTSNGFIYDEDGFNLSGWLIKKQELFDDGNLPKDQQLLLESLGYDFKTTYQDVLWSKFYNLAKIYYESYGNLNIPAKFVTQNGYEETNIGFDIGSWLQEQLDAIETGTLSQEKIELLVGIGYKKKVSTEKFRKDWLRNYNFLKAYFRLNANYDIPYNFRTTNGKTYNENGFQLRIWLDAQIKEYKNGQLSQEKIALFKEINLDLDNINLKGTKSFSRRADAKKRWMSKYNLIKEYYKHNKDLNLAVDFCTFDGYTYHKDGINLYSWLQIQRNNYKEGRLSEERIKLLEELGEDFVNNLQEEMWNENYSLLKKYHAHYNHINIPSDFQTIDGVNYCEYGANLGEWLKSQRNLYRQGKLLPERFLKINELNMLWCIKKEDTRIETLCHEFEIDYEQNLQVLDRITYYELNAKISYLLIIDLPIVSDGKLHEIFTMCSANMKQKYGIDYENIILNFYQKDMLLERKEAC